MPPTLEHVKLCDLPSVRDERGVLTAVEGGKDIPLEIRRVFYMHHVSADRGGHAHIETDQLVVAAAGSFRVTLFDGKGEASWLMDDPTQGLYIPRLVFIELTTFSPGAVCLVLASSHYDMKKSLRNRTDYLLHLQNLAL